RYYRSLGPRADLAPAARDSANLPPARVAAFVTRGYAYVILDVRGSGASFGSRRTELSPAEVRDGYDVVSWIVRQPWSDGKVGATGTSYVGTTAELLLSTGHPAVKAVAPLFALYDAYPDIVVPGGVPLSWFARTWGRGIASLDRNAFLGEEARRTYTGVRPVDDDSTHGQLDSALAEHRANVEVEAQLAAIEFEDDSAPADWTLDSVSPANRQAGARARDVPVYSYSGWYDGAYPHAAITRFRTLGNRGSRLIIGPWSHGGRYYFSPDVGTGLSAFDHVGEQLRFFDRYLKGVDTGIDREPPVHYYTMGAERWHTAGTFPPPQAQPQRWFFGAEGTVGPGASGHPGCDRYTVDTTAGTGPTSRWNTLVGGGAVHYADRAPEDAKLLTYTSAPLTAALEVTGYPVVTLYVTSDARDGQFFAYLESVDATGAVHYVTEGELRAVSRPIARAAPYDTPVEYRTFRRTDGRPMVNGEVTELRFHLLPTSYRFPRGSRVRVAIGGADRDHFDPMRVAPPTLCVVRGGPTASRVDLPVMPSRSP
ncbi:MAG: CocE/NonD family hydrolase, partial [Thermoleophilaceae bacterium]